MAGAPLKIGVTVVGWRPLARKLRQDELLAGPWATAMKSAADIALSAMRGAAPVASGATRSSMSSKVQAKPVPRWAAVRTAAFRSSKRYRKYRYPKRQEFDPRSRNRGRLQRAFLGAASRIQGVLSGAARQIESKWRS